MTQLMIEVTAGIIPDQPMPEHTRRWSLTAEECNDVDKYRRVHGEAMMYVLCLQNPKALNWARMDWVWL